MPTTLLFSFAHPDDESFSGSGTAMKYKDEGARIVLVTATRGERGSPGTPPLCAPEDLGACREAERRDAARIIGFDELHFLDYRDQELANAPADDVRRALVGHIRRLRPDIVFTFDPEGVNRHPDHVAISRFTTDALAAAADPRWYPDLGEPYAVPRLLWTPPVTPWDAVTIEHVDNHPGIDVVIDVSPWRDRRAAALRAHRTQHVSIDRCFFNGRDTERILRREFWRRGPALEGPIARAPRDRS
jgi:LmbE family N-acetylglucosaminyl deacetylase